MGAAPRGEGREAAQTRRETAADRREWAAMCRHVRVPTMWGIPLRLFLAALALGLLLPLADRVLAPLTAYPPLDAGAVGSLLGIISGAMVTLAGLVFSALTAAMSLGVTALSVRISPVFQGDRVIQWGLGCFVGAFAYALLIALSIAVGGQAYRPWASTIVAVIITTGCGIMFIAVVVRVCRLLNPGGLLRRLAAEGREASRYDPARFHTRAAELATGTAAGGDAVRRRRRTPRGDVVLAVNIPRLLDCEDAWGMRIELVPSLGTPVPVGGLLFRTSAPASRAQCRTLESVLAFGDVLSPASGPFGAIRAMVDIALKALSPAVNDPSRAVQALDEIEDILAELAPDIAAREALLAAHPDASVLRDWTRSWDDYVAAATDEIRQYGTGSVQIQRRLRALFDTLAAQCEPGQRGALAERRAVLDRGLERWWADPLDRRLAGCADPQGLGRAAGTAEAPPA